MKKYIYIDDEDVVSIQSIIEGLNHSGQIEVYRMPLEQGQSIEKVYQYLRDCPYDGIIIDYMLNGNGPFRIGCNANSIAQYIRDLADKNNKVACPIVLCSTDSKLQEQKQWGYTSSDLYDHYFAKDIDIDYDREARVLESLADGYEVIANANNDISVILGRDISDLDERPFEPFLQTTIRAKQCADLILQDFFQYSGILISEEVLCARLGIAQNGAYKDILSGYASAMYQGIFCALGNYFWTDKVDEIFYKMFNVSLASVDAEKKIEMYKTQLGVEALDLALMDENNHSKRFWTICDKTRVALDPMEGYRLKEIKVLKPWQEPRFVSFSAISDGEVEENMVVDMDKERYRQKVAYLKGQFE